MQVDQFGPLKADFVRFWMCKNGHKQMCKFWGTTKIASAKRAKLSRRTFGAIYISVHLGHFSTLWQLVMAPPRVDCCIIITKRIETQAGKCFEERRVGQPSACWTQSVKGERKSSDGSKNKYLNNSINQSQTHSHILASELNWSVFALLMVKVRKSLKADLPEF